MWAPRFTIRSPCTSRNAFPIWVMRVVHFQRAKAPRKKRWLFLSIRNSPISKLSTWWSAPEIFSSDDAQVVRADIRRGRGIEYHGSRRLEGQLVCLIICRRGLYISHYLCIHSVNIHLILVGAPAVP